MVLTIKPKVDVVAYGPAKTLQNGNIIPDEFVWGASRITYKDIGTMEELRLAKEEEKDIYATVKKSLMKSAGSGHASMATTPGLWIMLEGNCSKMVDSAFTGYKFASSLMPSGRRIPIAIDQIVVPSEIEKSKEARDLYLRVSEANINAYENLQTKGVPKEEAAKIVQYGHRGGGFMFMPLETIIAVNRDVKRHASDYPTEIKEITTQLEDFARSKGLKVVYEARMSAPRTGCVNPNIFHSQVNEAQEAVDENRGNVLYHPILENIHFKESKVLESRLGEWKNKRNEIFSSQDRIIKDGADLVHELHDIVSSYNNSFQATISANIPWRVWGEDKRHRTMPLTTESIYHAVDRSSRVAQEMNYFGASSSPEKFLGILPTVLSLPSAVTANSENLAIWSERFTDSISAYETLVKMGIPKGDALNVVPRGIKLGVTEVLDLYNATTGHNSLRLCKTAEREKRETTEAYRDLLLASDKLPSYIKELLVPKCNYVGFCFEDKSCGRINKAIPRYNPEMHAAISAARFGDLSLKI
jgi:hypothetical protein